MKISSSETFHLFPKMFKKRKQNSNATKTMNKKPGYKFNMKKTLYKWNKELYFYISQWKTRETNEKKNCNFPLLFLVNAF